MIYLKTMLYEFEACMKYAILIKEKKKIGLCFIEYMQLGKIKPGQIRQSVNQSI